jgi:hypothetical protein
MSNMFSLSAGARADARRAKLDVVAAAMLNGGASGGWLMGRALRPCDSRRLSGGEADALSAPGVAHVEMPAPSERVWRAIRGARGAG